MRQSIKTRLHVEALIAHPHGKLTAVTLKLEHHFEKKKQPHKLPESQPSINQPPHGARWSRLPAQHHPHAGSGSLQRVRLTNRPLRAANESPQQHPWRITSPRVAKPPEVPERTSTFSLLKNKLLFGIKSDPGGWVAFTCCNHPHPPEMSGERTEMVLEQNRSSLHHLSMSTRVQEGIKAECCFSCLLFLSSRCS